MGNQNKSNNKESQRPIHKLLLWPWKIGINGTKQTSNIEVTIEKADQVFGGKTKQIEQ